MFECCICQKYARRTLAEIMRHIRDVHPHFDGTVRCGVEGCPSTASSYESLRQHMYNKHKHILKHNHPTIKPRDRSVQSQWVHVSHTISIYRLVESQLIATHAQCNKVTTSAAGKPFFNYFSIARRLHRMLASCQ